jgi:hypothetical protein
MSLHFSAICLNASLAANSICPISTDLSGSKMRSAESAETPEMGATDVDGGARDDNCRIRDVDIAQLQQNKKTDQGTNARENHFTHTNSNSKKQRNSNETLGSILHVGLFGCFSFAKQIQSGKTLLFKSR